MRSAKGSAKARLLQMYIPAFKVRCQARCGAGGRGMGSSNVSKVSKIVEDLISAYMQHASVQRQPRKSYRQSQNHSDSVLSSRSRAKPDSHETNQFRYRGSLGQTIYTSATTHSVSQTDDVFSQKSASAACPVVSTV